MNIKVVGCKKPKGYYQINIVFSGTDKAEKFIKNWLNRYEYEKLRNLEHPSLSKTKRNMLLKQKQPKFLLTKHGSNFMLWKELA